MAQGFIEQGHVRISGERTMKTSAPVHVGDIITMPCGDSAIAIFIESLPVRRGPSHEALSHYSRLDGSQYSSAAKSNNEEKSHFPSTDC